MSINEILERSIDCSDDVALGESNSQFWPEPFSYKENVPRLKANSSIKNVPLMTSRIFMPKPTYSARSNAVFGLRASLISTSTNSTRTLGNPLNKSKSILPTEMGAFNSLFNRSILRSIMTSFFHHK